MFNGVPAFNLRGSGVAGCWGVGVVEVADEGIEGEAVFSGWRVGESLGVRLGDCTAKFATGVLDGGVVCVGWVGRIST